MNRAIFDSAGRRVVTVSDDKTIRLWKANTGEPLAQLEGHQNSVVDVNFSPSGQYLLTASRDNTARLWHIDSGKVIAILSGHETAVTQAIFSPDGQHIFTASEDKTVRRWPVFAATQALIDYAHILVPGQLMPTQRQQFYLD
ncbi:MAG: hypothetical protein HC877_22090 [Thioploca sp.]|nr:hypothetical protein [Thioploca sp.]